MIDTVEMGYTCETNVYCCCCEYCSFCQQHCVSRRFTWDELHEATTIQYAEGEI